MVIGDVIDSLLFGLNVQIHFGPFIMLCLGSIEMDRVVSEPCYKGTVLHSNYRKGTMP